MHLEKKSSMGKLKLFEIHNLAYGMSLSIFADENPASDLRPDNC